MYFFSLKNWAILIKKCFCVLFQNSRGVVLFAMVTGNLPFLGKTTSQSFRNKCKPVKCPDYLSSSKMIANLQVIMIFQCILAHRLVVLALNSKEILYSLMME